MSGIEEPVSNLNGLAVGPDGKVYFTSMFTGFHFSEGLLGLLAASDPSGRVYEYNPKDEKVTIVMDK